MAIRVRIKAGQTGNVLLDKLAKSDLNLLAGQVETLHLDTQQVLFQIDDPLDHVYFPVSAVLSLVVPPTPHSGPGIEIASVGSEGIVGFTALLGVSMSFHLAVCQVPGTCLSLPVPALADVMARRPACNALLKRYMAIAYQVVTQGVVCNTLHRVEQRVCRWLLVMHDKVSTEFPATQDFLASRLGVNRPTVSLVANSLLKAGLITYHRGSVRILDRARLEQCACPCFTITKSLYQRILGDDLNSSSRRS